jgi:hypothetical protein
VPRLARRSATTESDAVSRVRRELALAQPARLQLPLFDPQVARELGVYAFSQAIPSRARVMKGRGPGLRWPAPLERGALEVASEVISDFDDGVFWVPHA